jgi:hypothetical protein
MRRSIGYAIIACTLGCRASTTTTVPLLRAAGAPITVTASHAVPLEVVTHTVGTEVPDPLPVEGSAVSYADVEPALGHAIGSAVVPWAKEHRDQRPSGWRLQVDLIAGHAAYDDGRLTVTFSVRATLRARSDYDYLAQADAHCLETGRVDPRHGASVVYTCMTRLGRDLAGWLGSVEP